MTLSRESEERIALLHRAARSNGSLVTLQELRRLLGEDASESELAEAIRSIPALNSEFELRGGYLTERDGEGYQNVEVEASSRRRAEVNLSHAARFAFFLHSVPFEMVAVSGSTAYGSASLSQDLDLFCVAPKGRMWISVTKGLLMARAFGIMNRDAPKICLSCIMDEVFARSSFASERDPLFARDAIETKVVKGNDIYRSLMSTAGWISDLYPVAYSAVVGPGGAPSSGAEPTVWDRILNKLLFVTTGSYVRLKASLVNRDMKRQGRGDDTFRMRFGEGHLIYESKRYSSLRERYSASFYGRNGREA